MSRRLLLLLGTVALLALSTVSASSLGSLTDVTVTQSIQNNVDPCAHDPGEPDPCLESLTPDLLDGCSGAIDDDTAAVGTDGDDCLVGDAKQDDTGADPPAENDALLDGVDNDTPESDQDDDLIDGDDTPESEQDDDLIDGDDDTDSCDGSAGKVTITDCG